ncbi:hypothetical protein [Peribacillus loiseleuriae]|uniref:hypothetical protein n=1 Tax=Peribacillus loiseleuriae TaxID=1679170 RepID=UPI003D087BFF
MKIINEVERINLQEEIKQAKQKYVMLVRVPLLTNFRITEGKLQYEIEKFIETPAHLISDKKRNLN